jgi:hypothetical protein
VTDGKAAPLNGHIMDDYRVLYYPDFSPDPTWLRQILLLSDGVARIVPNDVDPDDPVAISLLNEEIPGCLRTIVPTPEDVAIEYGEEERLARVFHLLGQAAAPARGTLEIRISDGGKLGIAGHVFVHDRKLSEFVRYQLRNNGLIQEAMTGLAPPDYLVVHEDASRVILAGVAAKIAGRTGMDTITEKPLAFAFGALRGVPYRSVVSEAAEGALLSAIAEVAIPGEVESMPLYQYRELRESYEPIRRAFKSLTAEWTQMHRLTKFADARELSARVEALAQDFDRQCREYRASGFARAFKSWTPLAIGGVLTVASAVAAPAFARGLAIGSVVVTVIQELLKVREDSPDERVFNMLSGLRRDIIAQSGIQKIV